MLNPLELEKHDHDVLQNPCRGCGKKDVWVAGIAKDLSLKIAAHANLSSAYNIPIDDVTVPAVPVYQCLLCGLVIRARHRDVWWNRIATQFFGEENKDD